MTDESATPQDDNFGDLQPIKDTPLAPSHAVAAVALNLALKYHDMGIIKDGTLYQQFKLEGRTIDSVGLDDVFETAIRMEAFLLGASDRIAKLIVDAIAVSVEDDKEPPEHIYGDDPDLGNPFICTVETPWTTAVTEKLTLHPAARRPNEDDGMPPTVERFCPICTYAWIKEAP